MRRVSSIFQLFLLRKVRKFGNPQFAIAQFIGLSRTSAMSLLLSSSARFQSRVAEEVIQDSEPERENNRKRERQRKRIQKRDQLPNRNILELSDSEGNATTITSNLNPRIPPRSGPSVQVIELSGACTFFNFNQQVC